MTETPPPEEWLLTTTAIPYWAIALVLLIAVVIIAIFNVQAGQPSSNPSNIQKRFGLITWSRRAAHIIIGLWGCALAMLMGAFFLISLQLIQEILDASNQDTIRHLAIALPAVAAANAGLIALPITLNRLQLTNRQTLAEEEGLITDRINAAVLGLGAEKTVKDTVNGQVLERTEPNIEVRVGAILALERIAKKNLDVHVQIMEIFTTYLSENASAAELVPTSVLEQIQPPRLDDQIIFNVIGRRTSQQRNREKQDLYKPTFDRINFSHAKLSGLDFSHSNFLCCYFLRTNSENTDFHECLLDYCNFEKANLERANFNWCSMQTCGFKRANLVFAQLCDCYCQNGDFDCAHMFACDCSRLHLVASFFSANDALESVWHDAKLQHMAEFQMNGVIECYGEIFADGSVKIKQEPRPAHWPDKALELDEYLYEYSLWKDDKHSYTPPHFRK